MRVPDPIANTTTEAYLAYKAGYLEESELKPSLYDPYLHFDAWLAYWCGLTNTYPTNNNGDPEMLTDEEALVAYLAEVTNTYPEEPKDPYEPRIASYLRYLISAKYGRPEYPVNNSEFYLSTMKPPVVPSGDPSSSIDLDGTVEAPFVSMEMYGDTYQKSYSGKNLITLDALNNMLRGVTSKTEKGITFTVSEDGSVTVSGKSTDIVTLEWPELSLYTGDYELSGCPADGSDTTYRMDAIYTSGGSGWAVYDYGEGGAFRCTVTGGAKIVVRVRIASGVTMDNVVFHPVFKGKYLKHASGSELVLNGTTATGNNIVTPQTLGFTLPAGTYTWSMNVSGGSTSGNGAFAFYLRQGISTSSGEIANRTNASMGTPVSFTISEEKTIYFQIYCNAAGRVFDNYTVRMQLEAGSSASDYEPYVGGVPSPNPDYPQAVQAVTGKQVVAVTGGDGESAEYEIDLGDMELCKIGNYQDYIYRDGNDWYLHEEIGETMLGGLTWQSTNTSATGVYRMESDGLKNIALRPSSSSIVANMICPHYAVISANDTYTLHTGISLNSIGNLQPYDPSYNTVSSYSEFKTWLTENNVVLYYVLTTPTDTQITNSALIAQLDALMEGGSYEGETHIRVSATAPDLPALLKVEAGSA